MDNSTSISISVSKDSVNEEMSMYRASMEDADRQLADGVSEDAISNESICKGDEILDTYKVTSDAILGGMGSVWRVYHKGWGIVLAMKRPQPKFFAEASKHRKEDFVAECENWIDLGLHANIVSCYYVREIGGVPSIFSEWMDGGSLRDRIRDGSLYEGTPDLVQERIIDLAIQAARGLSYSHEKGLIHQDMKPGNLLLSSGWDAKVADFGLAKARSQISGPSGYTREYCPKEQAQGETPAPWMDVYAWALTVLEMYTGERLWNTGEEAKYRAAEFMNSCKVPMPPEMRRLLTRCIGAEESAGTKRRSGGVGFFGRILGKKEKITIPDFAQIIPDLEEIYKKTTGTAYSRPVPDSVADTADSLNNKALSFLDLHQEEKAESLWEEALVKNPAHSTSNYNLNLHLLRSEKKYLYEIERQKAGSRVLEYSDLQLLKGEIGSVPSMRTDSSAETLEFYSDFIHAALSGNSIFIAYCNDNEAFEAAGPVIKRADKETGKILETDEMAEIRALEADAARIMIRPGADLAIVLLDNDTAALYDIEEKRVIGISEENEGFTDADDYCFSRDGSLLWGFNPANRDFVVQIPSMQIHYLDLSWYLVCRPRKGGLLFRNPQNSDALYLMESGGEFRKVFDFEKPLAERPCIEVDCEPDPFLCYTYEGSKDSFILDSDYQKTPVSKEFASKLNYIRFYDEGSRILYAYPHLIGPDKKDALTSDDRLVLWDLKKEARLCTMPTFRSIEDYSNVKPDFDPEGRELVLCEMNSVKHHFFKWYSTDLPAAPKDTVRASYRLSQIKSFSERTKEQEALEEAKRAFDQCFFGGDWEGDLERDLEGDLERALAIFRRCRDVPGFSGSDNARSMEEHLNAVCQKSGLRIVLPAGSVAAPPECVLDGSEEVYVVGAGGAGVASDLGGAYGPGGASAPGAANGASAPGAADLFVIYKAEKPEEGITISRADGSVIRHISLPRNTVYTTVRNDRIYAFEKNLKCKAYDFEGKLTDVYERNPVETGTIIILDLDAEGKKLLYSKVEGSDFLASDWVYIRELASGATESFTQRLHGEPFKFLQDGTVLYPKFDFDDYYQLMGYPYTINGLIRFDLRKWKTVRTYRIYEEIDMFKKCRIGMNQDRSMFYPEMDYLNTENGDEGRVIYVFDTDGDRDTSINHVFCAPRGQGQAIMLPGGRFIGGCGKKELWLMDIRDDSWREKFLEESEDCRLLFRPDGLEFYVQKVDAGGTWKRYRVEFEYD